MLMGAPALRADSTSQAAAAGSDGFAAPWCTETTITNACGAAHWGGGVAASVAEQQPSRTAAPVATAIAGISRRQVRLAEVWGRGSDVMSPIHHRREHAHCPQTIGRRTVTRLG